MDIDSNGPGGGFEEPPGADEEGIVRLSVAAGEAAVELVLDQRILHPGDRLTFRMVNRGRVELMTGRAFLVECWNGESWVVVPVPSMDGFSQAFSAEGRLLEPGSSTVSQSWPLPGMAIEDGWYRVVKSARWEGFQLGLPDRELVARARFRVPHRPRRPGGQVR